LQEGLFNRPGDDATPGRGVSMSCISLEIHNETTDVTTPAVLLASIGNGRGSNVNDDTPGMGYGKTWISYDSGLTWQQIAAFGSSRAALYAGSVTVPASAARGAATGE
jgi:hypothetical protein